jgi:hypothetical protein
MIPPRFSMYYVLAVVAGLMAVIVIVASACYWYCRQTPKFTFICGLKNLA